MASKMCTSSLLIPPHEGTRLSSFLKLAVQCITTIYTVAFISHIKSMKIPQFPYFCDGMLCLLVVCFEEE